MKASKYIVMLLIFVSLSAGLYGKSDFLRRDILSAEKNIIVNKNTNASYTDSSNCRVEGRVLFGSAEDIFTVGDTAYVCAGYSLLIFDIADKTNPMLLGHYDMEDIAWGVYVMGNYAYIANNYDGLRIIDVSDPVNPNETGFYDTDDNAYNVYVSGNYAYLTNEFNGLLIIDISDPANPMEISSYSEGSDYEAIDVCVVGDYAYIAGIYTDTDEGYLSIVDVSDPSNPVKTGYYSNGDLMYNVDVIENYAYIANSEEGLRIVDISNPFSPTEVGYYDANSVTYNVYVQDTLVYVVSGYYDDSTNVYEGYLNILNISDPTNPVRIGYYNAEYEIWHVCISNNYAYLAEHDHGIGIIDITDPTAPTETYSYETGGSVKNVQVINNYAYVAEGYYEHVRHAYEGHLRIIDVNNLEETEEIGYYNTKYSAQDLYVQDTLVYIAEGYYDYSTYTPEGCLQIINVSDPNNPVEVSCFDTEGETRSVYVSGNYAYLADGSDGLRIVDISDPVNPDEVGFYDTDGYTEGVYVVGDYAYVVDGSDGLRIVDISDPVNPDEVGFYDTSGYAEGVYVVGNYAYVADGEDGLCVIDISDPTSPDETGYYDTSGYTEGVYVLGDYAYVADGSDGLRIINVFNPENLFEIGYYNTNGNANGVYISNDYIYVSDYEDGLYIISFDSNNGIEKNTNISTDISLPYLHFTNGAIMNRNNIKIEYTVEKEEEVSLRIYTIDGRKVKDVYKGKKMPGEYEININNLHSGIYFIIYETPNDRIIKRFTVIE